MLRGVYIDLKANPKDENISGPIGQTMARHMVVLFFLLSSFATMDKPKSKIVYQWILDHACTKSKLLVLVMIRSSVVSKG